MPTFRKKPVEIEAAGVANLLITAGEDWPALPSWIREAYEQGTVLFLADAVEIVTLEGTMRGDWTDWIIRGVQGELYPCKDSIFRQTYEPV
jgi:hypothetical protein